MSPTRISASELKQLLQQPDPPAVVDVRDDDHFGGHVKGSVNVPSHKFRESLPELRDDLESNDKVVFYCMQSQQRGPNCAQLYADNAPQDQKVYVLSDGFRNWADNYGKDQTLTDKFVPHLYK